MKSLVFSELTKPLYHGSADEVSEIDLSKSVPQKDFGCGFYTTNDRIQAEKFAVLKAKRFGAEKGIVSVFKFLNEADLLIKKFDSSGAEWFDFVLRSRGYTELTSYECDDEYDIIIGPVANDAVGVVLNLFISGAYGSVNEPEAKETAIRLLLTQKLYNQVFFSNERACSKLAFQESYDVCVE